MSSQVQVSVSPDADALAHTIAEDLVERLAAVQAEGRIAQIALTGGTIAGRVYARVAEIDSSSVDWSRVDFWWGDERFVDVASVDRNELEARRTLLGPLGVPEERVHPMPAVVADGPDVHQAATAYGEELRHDPNGHQFDVVLLGMGPDGHVASLFPGSAQLGAVDAIAVGVTDSPKPPPARITLTFEALNRTGATWLLVSGEEKAAAVARALADTGTITDTPARGLHSAEVTWYLDDPAASAL